MTIYDIHPGMWILGYYGAAFVLAAFSIGFLRSAGWPELGARWAMPIVLGFFFWPLAVVCAVACVTGLMVGAIIKRLMQTMG